MFVLVLSGAIQRRPTCRDNRARSSTLIPTMASTSAHSHQTRISLITTTITTTTKVPITKFQNPPTSSHHPNATICPMSFRSVPRSIRPHPNRLHATDPTTTFTLIRYRLDKTTPPTSHRTIINIQPKCLKQHRLISKTTFRLTTLWNQFSISTVARPITIQPHPPHLHRWSLTTTKTTTTTITIIITGMHQWWTITTNLFYPNLCLSRILISSNHISWTLVLDATRQSTVRQPSQLHPRTAIHSLALFPHLVVSRPTEHHAPNLDANLALRIVRIILTIRLTSAALRRL